MKKMPAIALSVALLTQSACGTLLHPERGGQKGSQLDPAIVVLDGIGLLFYLIPGLVAFAVDFNNGTIYLPSGKNFDQARSLDDARQIRINGKLDQVAINNVINHELAIPDVLNHSELQVAKTHSELTRIR